MIIKYLQGGKSTLPPLIAYLPVTVTGGTPSSAGAVTSSSKDEGDLTDKDLLEMLEKLDGLPSDMNKLTASLLNFYIDLQYSILPDTSNIASRYISVLNQMKVANFNKQTYDDALKTVSQNGGINELAISERGLLYCVNDKGDFKLLNVEELKGNTEYTPLTNSELLYYRAQSPDMAYKNDILKVVKNGIGIESVNKLILDTVGKIGTILNSLEGYINTKSGNIITGLLDFMEAVLKAGGTNYNSSIEDLYEYKYLTKDLSAKAYLAIDYIYKTLPENARALLKTKSETLNDDGAKNLIVQLITSQIDSTKLLDLDLIGGKTAKSTKTASGNKDNDDLKASLPILILKGLGYELDMIVDNGSGVAMSINGRYHSQVKTPDGKPIINTSLLQMLADSGLQSLVKNMRNITFGDLKVNQLQLANITYNNTGVLRANLPVNEDGTVRIDLVEDYLKAEAEIKLLGENATDSLKAEIYKEYNLDELLRSDGKPNPKKFAPFIVTEGYTTSTNEIPESEYIHEVKNPTDLEVDMIKRSLTIGTGKDAEVPSIDIFLWANPGDWFNLYTHVYKAAIYIPITNNVNAGAYGGDQNLDYDEALELEQQYKNFEKLNELGETSGSVL